MHHYIQRPRALLTEQKKMSIAWLYPVRLLLTPTTLSPYGAVLVEVQDQTYWVLYMASVAAPPRFSHTCQGRRAVSHAKAAFLPSTHLPAATTAFRMSLPIGAEHRRTERAPVHQNIMIQVTRTDIYNSLRRLVVGDYGTSHSMLPHFPLLYKRPNCAGRLPGTQL